VGLWLQRAPDDMHAHRFAASVAIGNGRLDEAKSHLKRLLDTPGVDREGLLIEVVTQLNSEAGKEDAMRLLDSLVKQYPGAADVHLAYALLASNKEEHASALKEIEAALSMQPDWNRARLLQAQILGRMGDSAGARQAIQRALQKTPNNTRLRLIYAQMLAKSGDNAGAERELERVLAKEPNNEDARFGMAIALADMGKLEKAKKEFLGLASAPKWQSQAYFYLGMIGVKENKPQAAIQWFDRIADGPLEFDARVSSVTALISLGRLDEARLRVADLRGKFPKEALRLYLLEGELLTRSKNYRAAFDLLTRALDELPGQPELLYTRALTAEQLDRVDILEADLRAVLEKNPDDANALNALGYTLAERGERLEEARKYLARALELKPEDPAILDSFGWLQYRLGNFPEALKYLAQSHERIKDPEIAAHYGEVLWESGRRDEARKVWREGMKKDPQHPDIQRVKARYPEAFR
jgi:tetratricopeptide (TPR) repeat protein